MAIITISRGSYSKGKEVAEKVAKKLGYECLSREVVLEASNQYNISEIKMVKAIHDAPTILENTKSAPALRAVASCQAAYMVAAI